MKKLEGIFLISYFIEILLLALYKATVNEKLVSSSKNARTKEAGGRYLIIIMSLFNDVIINLLLFNIMFQSSNKFAIRQDS